MRSPIASIGDAKVLLPSLGRSDKARVESASAVRREAMMLKPVRERGWLNVY